MIGNGVCKILFYSASLKENNFMFEIKGKEISTGKTDAMRKEGDECRRNLQRFSLSRPERM